jgi:exosortase
LQAAVTAVQTPEEKQPAARSATVREWVRAEKLGLVVTGVLVLILYARNFTMLWSDWKNDENYSHGFLVPVAFLWMLWERRDKLANAKVYPQLWALGIVLLSLLQLVLGTWGAENFTAHSSLLILLCGLTLFLLGIEVFRLLAFPIASLLFMIPLPAIIFYSITFPLQLVASRFAAGILDLLGVPSVCEGNVLYLANFTAGVAEACSGIRSLISMLAFAVLIGYFLKMSVRSRWILAASSIPIALGINSARVAGAGLVGNYLGSKYAEGFFHTFSGWILFMVCLGLTASVAQILCRFERPAKIARVG